MQMRGKFLATVALTLIGIFDAAAPANPYSCRQYYGNWQKHAQQNYYYRAYYYKPYPTYAGYKHHYVMYHPQHPKHFYYYNPYKKTYWGRCPVDYGGQSLYSKLADRDCRENLEDIPETAFPAPAKAPAVPEATDDATLELPPDDLPGGATPPSK
jgi:hypothetical protein